MPVAQFDELPTGYRGTEETIRRMHVLAQGGKTDLSIQKVADMVISKSGCANRDYKCKAQAIYSFVKSYVRFERDPFGVEMVQEPIVTLNRKAGDCDDHAILIGALYGSVGFPYAFRTVKADRVRPDEFSHVFAVVYLPGKGWIGADTSVDAAFLGWEPPKRYEGKTWPPKVEV
jgi:transglutaminase-like putative cysteine protease